MPQGFTSPSILFLNTWGSPEQAYCKPLLTAVRAHGYRRYVEPCSGAFVMPLVARAAGWTPKQMETSDVSLYSSVSGYLLAGRDLAELNITIDDEPLELTGPPINQAATILWAQLKIRMEARPALRYWQEIVKDLETRKLLHIEALCTKLLHLQQQLAGLKYEALDIWSHVDRVAGDPRTVINVNPPTYKSGFERFYETRGRLKWAEPEYSVWDPPLDVPRLMNHLADAKCLLLCQQQVPPRQASHPTPVYARHLSPGENVYFLSNRPEEVLGLVGLRVRQRTMVDFERLDAPVLPPAYPITPLTQVQVDPIPAPAAAYAKELWLHRITPKNAPYNLAVFLDGYLAGVAGYSIDTMVRPYAEKWLDAVVMTYAVGAPHEGRLTRLVTELVLQRQVLEGVVPPQWSVPAAKLVTSEFTRYPEAKGLRGLMKLATRTKDPRFGFKLVYVADIGTKAPQQVLEGWLRKEQRYKAQGGTAG